MMSRKVLKQACKPLCTHTIKFSNEVQDVKGEAYVQANPSTMHILEVDVEAILQKQQNESSPMYVGVYNEKEELSTLGDVQVTLVEERSKIMMLKKKENLVDQELESSTSSRDFKLM